MKRRSFMGASTGAATLITGAGNCFSERTAAPVSVTENGTLAGFSLEELREHFRHDLFDEFLPFVVEHVVDHEYGGFMCNVDRDGTRASTDKSTWNEGRGIWVFSYLYNNVDPNPKWLEIAGKSVDFILKTRPAGDTLWHKGFTRKGVPIGESDTLIYSDLFVANGLQEYSRAAGDEYWDMSKDIMLKCVDIYDNRPGYASLKATETSSEVSRPRIFSHWFQLGRLALHMLEKRQDSQVQAVADRCIDAVMNAHFNPGFRLITEYVNHDLSQIEGDYGQDITMHAQEVLWLVMLEAVKRGDRKLFDTAVERFKRHVEVLWDDVYGGLFALKHVDNNIWNMNKPLWLQVEVLFGTLTMIELTGDPWAKEWFERMYTYFREKFYLKKRGLPLWLFGGDRQVTFTPHTKRMGIFQQPRQLMLNLLTIDRMIENDGKMIPAFR